MSLVFSFVYKSQKIGISLIFSRAHFFLAWCFVNWNFRKLQLDWIDWNQVWGLIKNIGHFIYFFCCKWFSFVFQIESRPQDSLYSLSPFWLLNFYGFLGANTLRNFTWLFSISINDLNILHEKPLFREIAIMSSSTYLVPTIFDSIFFIADVLGFWQNNDLFIRVCFLFIELKLGLTVRVVAFFIFWILAHPFLVTFNFRLHFADFLFFHCFIGALIVKI